MEMETKLALELLRSAVIEKLGADPAAVQTGIRKKDNENGAERNYISMKRGEGIWQNVWADKLLDGIRDGKITMDEAKEFLVEIFGQDLKEAEDLKRIYRIDKEKILANVRFELLNRELNSEIEDKDPSFRFLDLIARFYMLDEESGMSVRITRSVADALEVNFTELYDAALRNTAGDVVVRTLWDIMGDLSKEAAEDLEPGDDRIYVLTNNRVKSGAASMFYADLFEDIAAGCNEDLWVIPSSRHEVMAWPKSTMPAAEAKRTMMEINATEVPLEDFLSNTLYEYNRGSKAVRIVG